MQPQGDGDLVMLVRSGNKEAFGKLIERYEPMAKRIAFGMLDQEDCAQEVTQEAFLAAYLSLNQLREPERFKTWLYSIVLNGARAFLKERKQNPLSLESLMGGMYCEFLPFSDVVIDPQEVAEEQELHHLLLSAVHTLSPKEQAATLLFYYQQLSLHEIAAILGISVIAVKSRLFKARQHLRRQLSPIYEEVKQTLTPTERKHAMAKVIIDSVRTILSSGQRVVILWDEEKRRTLSIWIAKPEALAIALGLAGLTAPRPTTTHFMANVLKATGVQIEEVRIETLKEEIFYAIAKVRNGESSSEIDVRPSDALGLALLMEAPIFVAEEVLEKYGTVVPAGKTVEVFLAEQWLESEGITLPDGQTIQIEHDKEQQRAALLQEIENFIDPTKLGTHHSTSGERE